MTHGISLKFGCPELCSGRRNARMLAALVHLPEASMDSGFVDQPEIIRHDTSVKYVTVNL